MRFLSKENENSQDNNSMTSNGYENINSVFVNNSSQNNSSSSNTSAVEHIRKFVFSSCNNLNENSFDEEEESKRIENQQFLNHLEIKIPELLQGGYSFYTWPCAPILAWFLWDRRRALVGKKVLELGAGTALPGILAAKCGAHVILSDNCILPKSLAHIRKCCLANDLIPGQDIELVGLSWGLLLNSVFNLPSLDLIIAADCFYDPVVFEDIIVTISFLLERNPRLKFIFTYQERSADWQIEALLKKWKLKALPIHIDDIGANSNIDIIDLMGGHTIHLIEVTKD